MKPDFEKARAHDMPDFVRAAMSMPLYSEAETQERGCAAIGVGGIHSDSFGEDGDGACVWCGQRPILARPADKDQETMREIKDHTIFGGSETVRVFAADEPGAGGMNHVYEIWRTDTEDPQQRVLGRLFFQNGPVREAGINGVTNEALLVPVLDRLRAAQKGDFACRENAIAITKLEEAMHWLGHRTAERRHRGVEGLNQK